MGITLLIFYEKRQTLNESLGRKSILYVGLLLKTEFSGGWPTDYIKNHSIRVFIMTLA